MDFFSPLYNLLQFNQTTTTNFFDNEILTSSVSVEFSSQGNVISPADRVNADVARSNGRREIVSDYGVSVAISTEYLNAENMFLLNATLLQSY